MIKINVSSLINSNQDDLIINEQVSQLSKEIELIPPLFIRGKIYKISHGVLVEVNLLGQEKVKCDRCGEFYLREIDQSFSQKYLVPGKAEDKEEYEEKAGYIIEDNGEIDLEESVIEEIAVVDIGRSLCREDCKGVCSKCGKNLNKEECSCYTKNNKKENPFHKLEDLKEKS